MTDYQENRFTMIQGVYNACISFESAWQGHAAFSAAFSDFSASRAALMDALLEQVQLPKPFTEDKKAARDKLIKTTFITAKALLAYAVKEEDHAMMTAIAISRRKLRRVRDASLEPVCRNVLNAATEMLSSVPGIDDYGITSARTWAMEQLLEDYLKAISGPREAISRRARATANIKSFLDRAVLILEKRLDGLALQFEETNPEFYDHYLRMRMVVDYSGREQSEQEVRSKK